LRGVMPYRTPLTIKGLVCRPPSSPVSKVKQPGVY
jgi:hypothetical protein